MTVSTNDAGETTLPDGTVVYAGERLEMTASDADPAHARMANEVDYRLDQDGHRIDVRASGETTSTETDFRMTVRLEVDLDGEPFFRARLGRDDPPPARLSRSGSSGMPPLDCRQSRPRVPMPRSRPGPPASPSRSSAR